MNAVSDEGCSEKCKLINKKLTIDLERRKSLLDCVLNFQWCDACAKSEESKGGGKRCTCGRKFMQKITPYLNKYEEKERELGELKKEIEKMKERDQQSTVQPFRKKKSS